MITTDLSQKDELRVANSILEEQTRILRLQNEDLIRRESVLRQNAADVQLASRYKSEFLANMSHELRTPLNIAIILSKLLSDNKEENLTLEQIKYARSIHSAGKDLLVLIDDILDISKIEAGKIDLHIEALSIHRLFAALAHRFEPLAADRDLQILFVVDPDCPETINTDAHRVQQILTNLLSNALKFTEQGTIRLVAASRGVQEIAFTVEDTGIGIPAHQHEVVFAAFRQAAGNANQKIAGTGLGLSICRELAGLLGGEIHLRSTPGEGSEFTVVLPLSCPASSNAALIHLQSDPQPPESAEVAQGCSQETALDGLRILLVEDDIRSIFALTSVLETKGAIVDVARNGLEALARLSQGPSVDLVLMDLMMPEMDGLCAMREIRRGHGTAWSALPVIALTAKATLDDREQALAAGANDYISKPIDTDKLVSLLRVWIPRTTIEES